MKTAIGSRWSKGFVEGRDSQTGFFEAINSKMESYTELKVQDALLNKRKPWWPLDFRKKK